jgi:hypothetical protein
MEEHFGVGECELIEGTQLLRIGGTHLLGCSRQGATARREEEIGGTYWRAAIRERERIEAAHLREQIEGSKSKAPIFWEEVNRRHPHIGPTHRGSGAILAKAPKRKGGKGGESGVPGCGMWCKGACTPTADC